MQALLKKPKTILDGLVKDPESALFAICQSIISGAYSAKIRDDRIFYGTILFYQKSFIVGTIVDPYQYHSALEDSNFKERF